MKNNILLVDDLRVFRYDDDPEYVTRHTARTSAEALEILENVPVEWTTIWLDHDLGYVDGKEDTIMPVVNYLDQRAYEGIPVPVGLIVVHTSNPVGRDRIKKILSNRGYVVTSIDAQNYFDIDMDLYNNHYVNEEKMREENMDTTELISLGDNDGKEIESLLVGRKVEYAKDGVLILDDGSRLEITPNQGCGGCTSGWFDITELNEVDNVITRAEVVYREEDTMYSPDVYSIFVYAENKKLLLAKVAGDIGNGYYGAGFTIEARLSKKN